MIFWHFHGKFSENPKTISGNLELSLWKFQDFPDFPIIFWYFQGKFSENPKKKIGKSRKILKSLENSEIFSWNLQKKKFSENSKIPWKLKQVKLSNLKKRLNPNLFSGAVWLSVRNISIKKFQLQSFRLL